ncbi:hypothetical protein D3C71_1705770 [compost metagenome]
MPFAHNLSSLKYGLDLQVAFGKLIDMGSLAAFADGGEFPLGPVAVQLAADQGREARIIVRQVVFDQLRAA